MTYFRRPLQKVHMCLTSVSGSAAGSCTSPGYPTPPASAAACSVRRTAALRIKRSHITSSCRSLVVGRSPPPVLQESSLDKAAWLALCLLPPARKKKSCFLLELMPCVGLLSFSEGDENFDQFSESGTSGNVARAHFVTSKGDYFPELLVLEQSFWTVETRMKIRNYLRRTN